MNFGAELADIGLNAAGGGSGGGAGGTTSSTSSATGGNSRVNVGGLNMGAVDGESELIRWGIITAGFVLVVIASRGGG